jgi:hypothetical protein
MPALAMFEAVSGLTVDGLMVAHPADCSPRSQQKLNAQSLPRIRDALTSAASSEIAVARMVRR